MNSVSNISMQPAKLTGQIGPLSPTECFSYTADTVNGVIFAGGKFRICCNKVLHIVANITI